MTLRACVVVPARDEEDLIGACITALAHQTGVARDAYEVILVLDRCTDATAERAVQAAAGDDAAPDRVRRRRRRARAPHRHGPRRRAAAAGRADRHHRRRLHARARLARDPTQAVAAAPRRSAAGSRSRDAEVPPHRPRAGEVDAVRRRAELRGAGAREHHQFSGASFAVTSATYTRVGRLEPRPALEDEGFERALRHHGIPIERLASVKVTTSGRRLGRAPRGLAVDLRRNAWLAERSYDAGDFSLDALLAAKQQTISVILPTRNVATTLGGDPGHAAHPLIDELLVVDGDSTDGTIDVAIERGVRAITQPHTGKGDAMRHGLAHTSGELVAYLDTDTEDFTEGFVLGLLGPLVTEPVDFVKGHFRRPFKHGDTTQPDGGGRVTELLARPYLNLHFPELAGFRQPLAGEIAATRSLLRSSPSRPGTASRSRC